MSETQPPFSEHVLASLDLETTGTDILNDRVVEIAVIRREPGKTHVLHTRVNPGMPIPPGATKVHGITDADVKDAPTLVQVMPGIIDLMRGATAVVGFNARRFDLPLLEMEFRLHGHEGTLPWDGIPLLDGMEVHRWLIPGTLSGAHRYWTGRELVGAHSAAADAQAALDVLLAQVGSSEDLAGITPAALESLVLPEDAALWVDPTGRLKRDEMGEPCLAFGKDTGKRLRDVDSSYLDWILKNSFHPRVMDEVRAEKERRHLMRVVPRAGQFMGGGA